MNDKEYEQRFGEDPRRSEEVIEQWDDISELFNTKLLSITLESGREILPEHAEFEFIKHTIKINTILYMAGVYKDMLIKPLRSKDSTKSYSIKTMGQKFDLKFKAGE